MAVRFLHGRCEDRICKSAALLLVLVYYKLTPPVEDTSMKVNEGAENLEKRAAAHPSIYVSSRIVQFRGSVGDEILSFFQQYFNTILGR